MAAKTLDTLATIRNLNPITYQLIGNTNEGEIDKLFPDRSVNEKDLKRLCKEYLKKNRTAFVLDIEYPWFILREEKLPQETNYGLYPDSEFVHLIGNVAELIREPGIVKGGSWRHKLSESFPSKRILVDAKKAYDWVGFRCVAEIILIKP